MDQVWKIIDVINWGKEYFSKKNIDSPRLSIELIISKVLNYDRLKLYTNFELPLKKEELSQIKEFIKRRVNFEPLQYILGETNFMGNRILLNNSVLIPRPETEELVDLLINSSSKNSELEILDIGTGSGCISISLAKAFKMAKITTVDISPDSVKLAEENAMINNVYDLIQFRILNIFDNFDFGKKFDLIVSNPPYISKTMYLNESQPELFFEPKIALTDDSDGLSFYRFFSKYFKHILKDNGQFFLEFGFEQENELSHIFASDYDIEFIEDFNKIKRFLIGKFNS